MYLIGGIFMKAYKLPMLALLLVLSGCTVTIDSEDNYCSISYDYSDFEDKSIVWNDLFTVEGELYYVYIYSPTCGHCNDIKEDVLCKVSISSSIFLLEYKKDIPIITDRNSVIGKTDIEDLGILGTPSMFKIEDHIITDYLVGTGQIIETLTNLP